MQKKRLFLWVFIVFFLTISSKKLVYAEESPRKTPAKAAFRSLLVPGWGQFYNEKYLKGKVFLGTEILTVSGTIATYILFEREYDKYKEYKPEAIKHYDKAYHYYQANRILFWVSVGVWAYNVVDAYWDAKSTNKKAEFKTSKEEQNYRIFLSSDSSNKQILLAATISF